MRIMRLSDHIWVSTDLYKHFMAGEIQQIQVYHAIGNEREATVIYTRRPTPETKPFQYVDVDDL